MIAMRGKFILVTLIVLVLDHVTKYIVNTTMELDTVKEIIPGYLRLYG